MKNQTAGDDKQDVDGDSFQAKTNSKNENVP